MSVKGFKAKDGTIHKYDHGALENVPENGTGEAGGYYTPVVTQPDETTMQVEFVPSKAGMPEVEPVQVTLPAGSSQNGDGLSDNAKALLITILRNGKYISDQSANITALEEALAGSGGEVQPSVYTVKNTLSNVSTNNPAASITGGESYSATLTADDGYVIDYIRVVMGGKDVTATAYADGVIRIASVTGNLEITVGASAITSTDIMQIGNTLSITGGVTVTKTDNVLRIA